MLDRIVGGCDLRLGRAEFAVSIRTLLRCVSCLLASAQRRLRYCDEAG
ncbi:hypothetical protein [Actinoalloteichus fjordicus]|nr:hypothetical protein [Actinoalloteichus fjordicus]